MADTEYEKIRDGLKGLPVTFYPGLLANLVKIILKNKVFKNKAAMMHFIETLIDNEEKEGLQYHDTN